MLLDVLGEFFIIDLTTIDLCIGWCYDLFGEWVSL